MPQKLANAPQKTHFHEPVSRLMAEARKPERRENRKGGAKRRVLITGTVGFIGDHLAQLLLAEGFRVQGYDRMREYDDVRLKQRRHQMLLPSRWLTSPRLMARPAKIIHHRPLPYAAAMALLAKGG